MTEKPSSERQEVEQSERAKKRLQQMLSDIESDSAEELIGPFTNYKDIFEIEKGFLISLTKTFFDQLFFELRAKLEAIKTGSNKPHEINWIVGHEVGHAARIYEMVKDQIPESEVDLHQRGEAILKLYDVSKKSNFKEGTPFDLFDEAELLNIRNRYTQEEKGMLEKQQLQKTMEEAEKMVNLFSAPLLNEQEKQSATEEMKAAIQAQIDSL